MHDESTGCSAFKENAEETGLDTAVILVNEVPARIGNWYLASALFLA